MNKQKELDKIAKEIQNCKVCRQDKIGKSVPGEGNPDAEIVFLGEAPGRKEAESGRPFIGRSGQLLRSLIKKVGLKEENVFITSPVKYLPKRGTPSKKEIEHGRKHLFKQLAIINPKIIVLLGNTASFAILDKKIPIKKEHGKIIEKDGREYYLMFHPAAALRFPPMKKDLEKDFLKLKKNV
jgi:uracil-DNA glycosylase